MKKKLRANARRILCFLLVLVLSLGTVSGAFAEQTQTNDADAILRELQEAPSPKEIADAAESFADALSSFADAASKSGIEQMLTRFSGVFSAVSGSIAILQMMGVIKDPTEEKLSKILDTVLAIQDQLKAMDKKLDEIITQLLNLAVKQEESTRATRANSLLKNWIDFRSTYINPLETAADEYNNKLARATSDWWGASAKTGITLLYTDSDKGKIATLSVADGVPQSGKADNGETITQWITIPNTMLESSATGNWDADHYKETFKNNFAPAFITAANNHSLTVSSSFYAGWDQLSDESKATIAKGYADDCLATLEVHLAYSVVNDPANDQWVTDLISSYKHYCSNVLTAQSGLDAIYNVQYGTHGFEGEVKDTIKSLGQSMIAATGVYGQLAMSVAGMSKLRTEEEKTQIRNLWTNTTNSLASKQKSAITGHDNYCYILGCLISYETFYAKSNMIFDYKGDKPWKIPCAGEYESYSAESWKVYNSSGNETSPAIVNDLYSIVIYDQYMSSKGKDDTSFAKLLNKYGVGIPGDFTGVITTSITGGETFPLSDYLSMTAYNLYGDRPQIFYGAPFPFNEGAAYNINNTGKSDDYFLTHDKFTHNYLESSTGALVNNQILAARASYINKLWCSLYDNAAYFCYKGINDADINHDSKITELGFGHYHDFEAVTTVEIVAPMYCLTRSSLPAPIEKDSPLLSNDSYYVINFGSDWEKKPEETQGDWKEFDNSVFVNHTGEVSDEYLDSVIESAMENAAGKGTKVTLTDSERKEIRKKIRGTIETLQKELSGNQSLGSTNVFNLSDEEAEKLAYEVLGHSPSGSNIKTVLDYEAGVNVSLVMRGGRPEAIIRPLYNITPVLVIWNSANKEFEKTIISDKTMEKLGLTATIRIPVSRSSGRRVYGVTHYKSSLLDEIVSQTNATVQGSGFNKYVEVKEGSLSPFELGDPKAANTGDNSNADIYLILLILSCLGIAAIVFHKKSHKQNS